VCQKISHENRECRLTFTPVLFVCIVVVQPQVYEAAEESAGAVMIIVGNEIAQHECVDNSRHRSHD